LEIHAVIHLNDDDMLPIRISGYDRLCWLENDFLNYLEDVKQVSEKANKECFTKETHEAIVFPTHSTVSSTKYLLDEAKFDYVLTERLNSDPIEGLFGNVRLFRGCNDMVDARAGTFALQKIL